MCGILGTIQAHGKPVDVPLFVTRLATLEHRGPDGEGVLLANLGTGRTICANGAGPRVGAELHDVALGHRRLAILDLSPAAAQPMSDAEGRVWISFNGEIYNFAELRRELEARGHRFRTSHSDTEVLLYAFKEWGDGCVPRLRGMFAFAILDLDARRLFLARDRIGKKPLYYRTTAEAFEFASELKALVAGPDVPRRIDPLGLAHYLVYNYVPAPGTIFAGIHKLPAAHCAWVELDAPWTISVRPYWHLRYAPDHGRRLEDWVEELDAELTEAVRLRMISDVPLGVLLSGGLDSSAVVRAMSRVATGPVKTFSIGFDDEQRSELRWAREVARRYGTEHHEEVVRPNAIAVLPALARQFDEPFADASALPTYLVCRMARRHVTVALSGDGGDELFAGYNRYDLVRKLARVDWVPFPARRVLFGSAARLWPSTLVGKGLLTLLSQDGYDRYREQRGATSALGLLDPDLRRSVLADPGLHAAFAHAWAAAPPEPMSRVQYVDTMTYLPDDILVKLDRASMLTSIETRCPLLDHRVVELAARMPADVKYTAGEKKRPLRRLLLRDLPPSFVHRHKKGFSIPRDRWLRGELAGYVRERLLSADSRLPDEIDRNAVRDLVGSYRRGNRDLSRSLWNLLVLEAWAEVYATPA